METEKVSCDCSSEKNCSSMWFCACCSTKFRQFRISTIHCKPPWTSYSFLFSLNNFTRHIALGCWWLFLFFFNSCFWRRKVNAYFRNSSRLECNRSISSSPKNPFLRKNISIRIVLNIRELSWLSSCTNSPVYRSIISAWTNYLRSAETNSPSISLKLKYFAANSFLSSSSSLYSSMPRSNSYNPGFIFRLFGNIWSWM